MAHPDVSPEAKGSPPPIEFVMNLPLIGSTPPHRGDAVVM